MKDKVIDTFLTKNNIDINYLQSSLDKLSVKGVDFADIFFERVVEESLSLDESIIKGGDFEISSGVGIRAVSKEKCGFAYSDVIDKRSIDEAINASISIVDGHNCDKAKILTDKKYELLYTSEDPMTSISQSKKVEILKRSDEIARSLDNRVTQVTSNISAKHRMILIANNDGTLGFDIKPISQFSIRVVLKDGSTVETGYHSFGGAFLLDRVSDDVIYQVAEEAVRIAKVNLVAKEAPAGSMNVVLGAGWPGVLIHEAVGHGLEGDFNRTKSSLYSDKIGQKVASSACTIIDDGTIKDRRGSLSIDDEGCLPTKNVLIENGILKNYMFDRQNALLMNTHSTGNGRRQSYCYLPQVRMTNTYMLPGDYTKEEIISTVKNGIYAVNFSGGQVDITSGKFVFTISEAYMIENGKITYPIKGASLIGNGPEVMNQVSMVGNDLEFDCGIGMCGKGGQSVPVGIGQPTLKIDNITVGGTTI